MGLIDTKINDILQYTHLIRHQEYTATGNSSVTHDSMVAYIGLAWNILTNLGGEDTVIQKSGGIDGYSSFIAFNPTKQIGLVVLCSCDADPGYEDINASLLVAFFIYGFELSQYQILEVASDDLNAPNGGMVICYTFSVPEEAVNPRLIGHYSNKRSRHRRDCIRSRMMSPG